MQLIKTGKILKNLIFLLKAILCYWLTTNLISLVQVGFLRIPTVRDYFKIERLITITPLEKKGPKKGFMQNMQEGICF